jgi:DNA-binding transcriptional MerR regulator
VTEKLFYRMGQVCEMTGLEAHVLRFWEKEFPSLEPGKNRSGHRVYTDEDIALIRHIKSLLHEEGFTIAGARQHMEDEKRDDAGTSARGRNIRIREEIGEIKGRLKKLLDLLDRVDGTC